MTPTDGSLEQIARQLEAAFKAKDAAKLASFYTESATLMPPGDKMVKGRSAIEAWFRPLLDRVNDVEIVPLQTASLGQSGFQVGTFSTRAPGNSPGRLTFKYALILKRDDGLWRIECDIWNGDQPPAPVPG